METEKENRACSPEGGAMMWRCMLVADIVALQRRCVARFTPCNVAHVNHATKSSNMAPVLLIGPLQAGATFRFVAEACNTSVARSLHRGVA